MEEEKKDQITLLAKKEYKWTIASLIFGMLSFIVLTLDWFFEISVKIFKALLIYPSPVLLWVLPGLFRPILSLISIILGKLGLRRGENRAYLLTIITISSIIFVLTFGVFLIEILIGLAENH